jgi:hypothetical protein
VLKRMMMEESMRQVEKTNWTESGDCLFFSIRGAGTLIPGSRPLKSALSPLPAFSIRGAGTLIPGSRLLKLCVDVYFSNVIIAAGLNFFFVGCGSACWDVSGCLRGAGRYDTCTFLSWACLSCSLFIMATHRSWATCSGCFL